MDGSTAARAAEPQWIGGIPHEPFAAGRKPLVPDTDPFYVPPAGFEHAAPGTVLRSRDVELAFLGLIKQRVTAMQLLYRSTNMSGAPEAAVTTVIIPADASPHRPCPIVSYQCAIDAIDARCFPSYAMRA